MKQLYENYTKEDLVVWSTLFNRQMENLKNKASVDYLYALDEMRSVLNANKLPKFEEINDWFSNKTGWKIECVPGLIPVDQFFELLADKKFPSSTWLRSMDKLDYLEEPDMFHDVFGHIPLLSNPAYSEFIHQFGKLGKSFISNEEKLLQLQRLYWFTIEFGLIKEDNKLRIYGAGILSSFGESISSLNSNEIERLDFDLMTILQTEFCTSEMQSNYFIIDSLLGLKNSIITLTNKWQINELEYIR
jgi:phenylalanine-4-hydroxylase